ncbi:MAG TPA: ornithine cyclodeaminase family protein [Steroidobacteraceae bacterium]|nr:ornithine cyclodeaminase family protein [Steroidobacteraceae bacterium]
MTGGHAGCAELLIVGGADVRRALPMSDCIEAVDKAMRAYSSGAADVPLRTIMTLPGGRDFFGVMPGYLGEPASLGAKVLTVYPDNPARGLPSHVGMVLLFDVQRGIPLAVMDAAEITAIRTAAASAVATRALARRDACHLAILGTGEQAATHLEAMAVVRKLRSVRIWGRSMDKAQSFAAAQGPRHSIRIDVCKTADAAVEGADIVCTVTAAREPVLSGSRLEPGAHVNLVGASRANAREADDDVVTRSRYFVDSRVSARAEAGELRHALEAGLVAESHVLGEIGEVLAGRLAGRTADHDITVYKSHGIAVQDLAAAHVIHARAMRDGLGTRAPF